MTIHLDPTFRCPGCGKARSHSAQDVYSGCELLYQLCAYCANTKGKARMLVRERALQAMKKKRAEA